MKIDHVQLAMPEGGEARARRFFVGLLEMLEVPKPQALQSRGGCWFRRDECVVHVGVDPDFRPQRKAHPAFLVDDQDGLARRLIAAGFACEWDDALGETKRFYVSDPFGNRIEILRNEEGLGAYAPVVARSCAALLRDDEVLMVHHVGSERAYWTLPGGHVEPGETSGQTAVRETLEETGVRVAISRALWDRVLPTDYNAPLGAVCRCFLVEAVADDSAVLGIDPEQQHLPPEQRLLRSVAWRQLDELRDDRQVGLVVGALGL